MSGLSRTPGKRVQDNILTGVRIPPSPPEIGMRLRNQAIFPRRPALCGHSRFLVFSVTRNRPIFAAVHRVFSVVRLRVRLFSAGPSYFEHSLAQKRKKHAGEACRWRAKPVRSMPECRRGFVAPPSRVAAATRPSEFLTSE